MQSAALGSGQGLRGGGGGSGLLDVVGMRSVLVGLLGQNDNSEGS